MKTNKNKTKKTRYAFFPLIIIAHGLPTPIPEYRFHDKRKWRFDFAFPKHKIAIEVDGGLWTGGRHTRGSGRLGDMEKFTAAACLGWRVLYFTPQQISTAYAIGCIKEALEYKEKPI